MALEKKGYWQEEGWNCLSARRKYSWSEHSDWQDVLSTYDCLIGSEEQAGESTSDAECKG
jgi:hypothetical protein